MAAKAAHDAGKPGKEEPRDGHMPHAKGEHKAEDGKRVENAYTALVAKHSLPPFAAMNAEFELDTIDPEAKRLLKEVAKKMFERTDLFRKVLEATSQPEMSIASMQEAELLKPAEHELIAELTRTLMRLDRQLLLAELSNTDADYASFIRDATREWVAVKRELTPIITAMLRGWSGKAQRPSQSNNQYLG